MKFLPMGAEAMVMTKIRMPILVILFVHASVAASAAAPVSGSAIIAKSHYNLGSQYMTAGLVQKAREEFKAAADIDSSFFEAQLQTGILFARENRLKDAAVYYARAIRLKPGRTDLHMALADIRIAVGDTSAAVKHYSDVLLNEPDNPRAVMALAQIAMQERSFAEAQALLDKSVSLKNDKRAIAIRAYCNHQRGRLADAATLYEQALKIDPADGDLWMNLGIIRAAQGQPAAAADGFERAATLGAARGPAFRNLGFMRAQLGRDEDAASSFRQALAENPRDYVSQFHLAKALVRLSRNGEALRELEMLRQAGVDLGELAPWLGRAYFATGDFVKAQAYLERSCAMDVRDSEMLSSLAETYRRLGRMDLARQSYEKLLAMRPGDVRIYRQLTELYAAEGNAVKALDYERRAREAGDRNELQNALSSEQKVWRQRMEETKRDADAEIERIRTEAAANTRRLEEESRRALEEIRTSSAAKIKAAEEKAARDIAEAREKSDRVAAQAWAQADSRAKAVEEMARRKIEEIRARGSLPDTHAEIRRIRREADEKIEAARIEAEAWLEREREKLRSKAPLSGMSDKDAAKKIAELEKELRLTRGSNADAAAAADRIAQLERELAVEKARRKIGGAAGEDGTDAAKLARRVAELELELAAAEQRARGAALTARDQSKARVEKLQKDLKQARQRSDTDRVIRLERDLAAANEAFLEAQREGREESDRLSARVQELSENLQKAHARQREILQAADGEAAAKMSRIVGLEEELKKVRDQLQASREEVTEERKRVERIMASMDSELMSPRRERDAMRDKLLQALASSEKDKAIREESLASAERTRATSELSVKEMRKVVDALTGEVERGLKDIGADTSAKAGNTSVERLKFYVQNVRLTGDARVARLQLESEDRLTAIRKRSEEEVSRILKDAQAQVDRARSQTAEEVRRAQQAADSEMIRRVFQEKSRLENEALAKRLAMAEQLRAEIEADAQVRYLEEKARIEASYEADRIRMQRDYDQQIDKLQTEYQRRLEASQTEAKRASDQLEALTRNDTALLTRSEIYQRIVRENAVLREDLSSARRRLEELGKDREQAIREAEQMRSELAAIQMRLGAVEEEARRYRGVGVLSEALQKGVNLNAASLADLQTLPGIGIHEARNIVWYRENIGAFKNVDELLKVPGLEATKAQAIRGLIRVR